MPRHRSFRPAVGTRPSGAFRATPRRRMALVAGTAVLALTGGLLPMVSQAADGDLSGPSTKPGPLVVHRGITSTDPALDPPADVTDAVAVTSTSNPNAENTALALRADGTVVGWGADSFGQATPPAGLSHVVAVDLGGGFGVALRADGTVAGWGSNASGALDVPAELGRVTAVSAGGTATPTSACGYVIALREDRTVARWGGARNGACRTFGTQFDPPAGLTDVVAISAGSTAAMALKADGTVVAWGSGTSPNTTAIALNRWHDITAVSTDTGKFIGLQADHTVVTWGFVSQTPMTPVPDGIVAVSAGETATFLSADGSLHERGRQSRDTEAGYFSAAAAGFDFTVAVADADDDVPTPPAVDPTDEPTADPTSEPTADPTSEPTAEPTSEPTADPTSAPTADPTSEPTADPTSEPTAEPTSEPTADPTSAPTAEPTSEPTADPTPTTEPTPTVGPTPTAEPTPTTDPTPTVDPTPDPTPTVDPTSDPTPTVDPTPDPTPTVDPTPAPEASDGPVLGSAVVQERVDSNRAGLAEAFRYTAAADATVSRLHVYLDDRNAARVVVLGVYSDADGAPGRLLSSGRLTRTDEGAWNTAQIEPVTIERGQRYWLSMAAPLGAGTVRFRDLPDGTGGPAVTSAGRGFALAMGLPRKWRSAASFANAPASIYVD